ncbi:MAG: exodeoxyribonuclease V subunit alpha [Metallibacterium scheffleri]|jgi:exodeoxyribonuclease V alpha subunit|uniref:exodeoxyribonuclease V subunit alpha n=1 Tax=Metallibacterium scheffleri TaxID=993689 RepID=UPI0026EC5FF8|nr:exodeoxyribonuclease V subunit alpha [Metallibacterium scheffleri]MCK9367031.1 exodeoxyribonuclease V subunit alpha [Metallibacterium scheffleri]
MNPAADALAPELALHAWVLRHTGDALLARAAASAARAERAGHACAWLGEEGFDAAQLVALCAAPWVSAGVADAPFVLDAAGRFYLRRNAAAELAVAAALQARATTPFRAVQGQDALLQALLPGAVAAEQRGALAAAFGRKLFVLSGGPGTGKTTSLLALLLGLLLLHRECGWPEVPRIALAAPTGKAAARLQQALRTGMQNLRARLHGDAAWQALLPQLPALQAGTLHRLLGARLQRRGAALAADIVAVDEASMVDLGLMHALLQALRPDSLLILLGDPDQLASVEAGSVLADIIAAATPGSALAGCIGHLTRSHRAQAGLLPLLAATRAGDAQTLLDAAVMADTAAADTAPLFLRRAPRDAAGLRAALHAWLRRHEYLYLRLLQADLTPAEALRLLGRAQLLCALRSGPFGQLAVNHAVEAWQRQQQALAAGFWYPGRVVMITRNDVDTGLANGDVGVALRGRDGLEVWFDAQDADGLPAPRALPPHYLPEHEAASAITIHKSQGSEYDHVAVLLPLDAGSPILSRELVYTALSRARHGVELWSGEEALRAALSRPVRRAGGLRERLQGC